MSALFPIRNLTATAILLVVLMALPPFAHAKLDTSEQGRVYSHTAVQGETLLALANRYLKRAADWPQIAKLNNVADPRRLPVGKVVSIPVALMRTEYVPARVLAAGGKAELLGASLMAGAALKEGDTVRTGDDGFVTLQLADGSTLTLQSRSALKVNTTRQLVNTGGVTDQAFRLDNGRLETRVVKQRGPAARFEIETPTSNMGVRGTVFRAGTDGAKVAVTEVTEGRVATSAAGRSIDVDAGYGTVVEAGKPPSTPVALLDAPKLDKQFPTLETVDARFAFGAVPKAVAYRTQVASDENFVRLLADTTVRVAEATFADLPDGNFFLRVRGIDAQGLEGKDAIARFAVKARPFAPTLLSPLERSRHPATVQFTWRAANVASTHRLQLAQDGNFAKPAYDVIVPPGTHFKPEQALQPGPWKWRMASVAANSDARTGPWSEVRTFEVLPADVQLIPLPDKTAIRIGDGTGQMSWRMQVAQDRHFARIVIDQMVTGRFDVNALAAGAYYVRLKPADGGDWSTSWTIEVYPSGWHLSPPGVR
jgi:hypothetical protein